MPAKVLIVDDYAPFRQLARRLVQGVGLDVIGEASTGSEALSAVERMRPDVVLLDIQLPDLDGLAVAKLVCSVSNAPIVVLVSSRDAVDYGPRLKNCGALGFIAKADLSAESLLALLAR